MVKKQCNCNCRDEPNTIADVVRNKKGKIIRFKNERPMKVVK